MSHVVTDLALREPDAPQPAEVEVPIEEICFPDLPADVESDEKSSLVKAIRARQTRARLRAAALITLKGQGYSYGQIAEMVGLSVNAVKLACKRARARGKLNDLRATLENESMALAVDSLNHHLRAKDKQMTIEHLKGMGQYRHYNNNHNDGVPGFTMPALQVNVVVQAGMPAPTPETFDVSDGEIGVPRVDDDGA